MNTFREVIYSRFSILNFGISKFQYVHHHYEFKLNTFCMYVSGMTFIASIVRSSEERGFDE